jgi:hypothetical protein
MMIIRSFVNYWLRDRADELTELIILGALVYILFTQ